MIHPTIKQQFIVNKKSWINSSKHGLALDDKLQNIPWYCYDAIKFLEENLLTHHQIFEFGCGSSTIYFQKRVKRIVSLETDPRWFRMILKYFTKNNDNYILTENYFRFNNLEIFLLENAFENDIYENFATKFALKNNFRFDFIIVDSIKRYQSAINSINAITPSGTIILDDAERKNYKKIINFFKNNNFTELSFEGISPAQLKIKKTCFLKN